MKISWLLICGLLFSSCSKEDILIPQSNITMELDGRLPKDANGYYHLKLNQSSNQTIHRITGKVSGNIQPIKIEWESNLFWWFTQGETVARITQTYVNYYTGQITYVNLPPLVNWKDVLVPTINSASYSDSNNEINTVVGPIKEMLGDTLIVDAKIIELPKIKKQIKIVLE
jgi:hypothetical protein